MNPQPLSKAAIINHCCTSSVFVPVHHLTCSTTAAGIQSSDVLISSLKWLAGADCDIEVERTNSYHGSTIQLLSMQLKRGRARACLSRLGRNVLEQLTTELEQRLDDDRCLHFRLSQAGLACGQIRLANRDGEDGVVKVSVKLEVYPGDEAVVVAQRLLTESLVRSIRRGWSESPPSID